MSLAFRFQICKSILIFLPRSIIHYSGTRTFSILDINIENNNNKKKHENHIEARDVSEVLITDRCIVKLLNSAVLSRIRPPYKTATLCVVPVPMGRPRVNSDAEEKLNEYESYD